MPLRLEVRDRNLERLDELSPAWFYSWSAEPASGFAVLPEGIPYVPMSWGRFAPANHQQTWTDGGQAGLYDTLLGFNEPDLASQANMTVTEALDLWPTLEATGLRLGSPAAANASGSWMSQFMQGVQTRGLRVDFLAVHAYSGDNPQAFLNRIDSLHQQHNLPIWITEFGVRDGNAASPQDNRFTDQQVFDFMAAVLPELESRGFVERYAWFPAERDNRFLTHSALHEDSGELTALGRLYRGELYLKNAGFESPDIAPPATSHPAADGWTLLNSAAVTNAHAHSGDQSVRIAPDLPSGQSLPGIARQEFSIGQDVHPDSTYSLGAWVFHPSSDPLTGTRRGSLRLQWFDEAGSLIGQETAVAIDANSPTGEWFFASLDDVLIPDNAAIDLVRATLWVNNVGPTSVNSGAAYFDDIVFVPGSLPPSMSVLMGDYDGDGFVSQADLDLVLLNWGDTVLPAGWVAAAQFDGVAVSQNELDAVLLNWGTGVPTPQELNTIPEPATLTLWAGIVLLGRWVIPGR